MSHQRSTALVVGAGPVGLLAACELIRQGIPCRVVDPKSGPTDESRALGIHARTLELFDRLGFADMFVAKGRKIRGMIMHKTDGRPAVQVDMAGGLTGVGTPFPYILAVPQSDTERLLLERLGKLGGTVEWGTRLETLKQDEGGVDATLRDGLGREETARFAWLLGCDGAHSTVRHALGIPFEGAAYEEKFLLADAAIGWDQPDDFAHMIAVPGVAFLAFPLPGPGNWRLIDVSGEGESLGDDPAGAVARFQELLRKSGFPDVTVSRPRWVSAFRVHRRLAGKFRVGRCFIAGDAAHIHSPAGGQGMNTGLMDAANLAWKLGQVSAGLAPERLLDSYEAERRPVVSDVLSKTDALTRMITLHNSAAIFARNAMMKWLGGRKFVQRKLAWNLSQLGVTYVDSPAIAEDVPPGTSGARAGSRAPDVPLTETPAPGQPSRLFETIRDEDSTLLLFTDDAGRQAERLRAAAAVVAGCGKGRITVRYVSADADAVPPPGARVLQDPEGRITRAFLGSGSATSSALVLIRPDGVIGYRARPADAGRLRTYLTRVFG